MHCGKVYWYPTRPTAWMLQASIASRGRARARMKIMLIQPCSRRRNITSSLYYFTSIFKFKTAETKFIHRSTGAAFENKRAKNAPLQGSWSLIAGSHSHCRCCEL